MADPILPELLKSCQAGDSSAVVQLVAHYRPAVYRLALSVLDDAEAADEVAQDAFLAVLAALPDFRGQVPFTTWLYAITLDVCRRPQRRRSTGGLSQAVPRLRRPRAPIPARAPETDARQGDGLTRTWEAVARLPEPLRLVVVLRYYHDLQAEAIAAVLRIDERAVHERLAAAHARLRGLLPAEAVPP